MTNVPLGTTSHQGLDGEEAAGGFSTGRRPRPRDPENRPNFPSAGCALHPLSKVHVVFGGARGKGGGGGRQLQGASLPPAPAIATVAPGGAAPPRHKSVGPERPELVATSRARGRRGRCAHYTGGPGAGRRGSAKRTRRAPGALLMFSALAIVHNAGAPPRQPSTTCTVPDTRSTHVAPSLTLWWQGATTSLIHLPEHSTRMG